MRIPHCQKHGYGLSAVKQLIYKHGTGKKYIYMIPLDMAMFVAVQKQGIL